MESNTRIIKGLDLKLKGTDKHKYNRSNVKKQVVAGIKEIPDYEDHKLSQKFTELICDILESTINVDSKVDKKNLLIEIMTDVFNLDEKEQETIKNQVGFLHESGLIKKLSRNKRLRNWAKSFFF